MPPLVSCPHCAVHCKIVEEECPHCGKTLRGSDGRLGITAAAAVLGLTLASCSEPPLAQPYGVPQPTEVTPVPPPDPTTPPTAEPSATPSAAPSTTAAPEPSGVLVPKEPEAVPAYGVPVDDPLRQ